MAAIALVARDLHSPEPTGVRLLLPVPGDLRGVPETVAALELGVALWRPVGGRAHGDVGLGHVGTEGLRWRWQVATGTPVPVSLREARQSLKLAVLDCGRELADLDVAHDDGGRIAVDEADRSLAQLALPAGLPNDRISGLRDAIRLLSAARWALESAGTAASVSAVELRRRSLVRLERAAREAIEAALSPAG